MKRIRLFLACIASRLTRFGLRLLGRGGTALPGKIALKLCPDLLSTLGRGVDTVIVTGTNGKSTSAGMLRKMLDEQGIPYFSNKAGSNMTVGIAAEYIENATLGGKPRTHVAVIECDEGKFPAVVKALQPKVILVTNLFRDQLDRYGDVNNIRGYLAKGIASAPGAVLCLNADCSLTASLGQDVPNSVIYYGVDGVSSEAPANIADAPQCLRCGEKFIYTRYTYAHLGDWSCPRCGNRRPTPPVTASAVETEPAGGSRITMTFPAGERRFRLPLPALYNVYNAMGCMAAAEAMHWDADGCIAALEDFSAVFGRMEAMQIGSTPVQVILVKNPAGCDRALEHLLTMPENTYPIFCLNDTIADGVDISWIWDTYFEMMFRSRTYSRFGVYGARAQDLRLRLKYAGAPDETITVFSTVDELAEAVKGAGTPVCVMPNYSTMLTVRDKLSALSGGKKFWE